MKPEAHSSREYGSMVTKILYSMLEGMPKEMKSFLNEVLCRHALDPPYDIVKILVG